MTQSHHDSHKTFWSWQQWLAVGIILLGFLLSVTSVDKTSVTMDEPVHALTGYSIYKTGDLRLVEDHPPLLEMVMSFPIAMDPLLPQPETLAGWEIQNRRAFGYDSVWMQPSIDRWLVPSRLPITFFAVVLCAVVYRWTADMAGATAAVVCAVFIACDPNIIANAGLATLDLGVTTLSFTALFVLYRLIHKPGYLRVVCGGIILGLAVASKISALPLFPIAGLWMLGVITKRHWSVKQGFIRGSLYFGISLLTVWATHLFDVQSVPGFPWNVPAPTYWESLRRITQHIVTENRYSFLLGNTYRGGVWTFFPVTFGLKTPVGVLILLVMASICSPAIWRLYTRQVLYLCLYPIIYVAVSLSGALNLGYRHLLPILPYCYVFLGLMFATLQQIKPVKAFFGIVVILQVCIALITWPDYIPYFNAFAGGSSNGYRYLADSSVDWGQGLKAVGEYVETNDIVSPYISAFTPFLDPNISYGLNADLLPPLRGAIVPLVLPQRYNPKPGDYIISASTLRGLQVADQEMYNWFWHREPNAVIAGSMLHYHVESLSPEPGWVAQCSEPVTPLSPENIKERFGLDDLRVLTYDCTQSWIFPGGGQSPGWTILHTDMLAGENVFRDVMLETLTLSFEQRIQRDTPTHVVYISEYNDSQIRIDLPELIISPGEWPHTQVLEEGIRTSSPVDIGQILRLIGVDMHISDQTIEVWTMWDVNGKIQLPVSLMAHIINQHGEVISVGDGLGIPFTTLQPGDIFVQRHVMDDVGPDIEELWFQTGVYRLDTLERYPVGIGDEIVGDRILIDLLSKK